MAVILFIAELNTETSGVLSVGALVAFLLGALILFRPFEPDSPAMPNLRVSLWLIAVTTAAMGGFIFFVIGQAVRARKAPVLTGYEHFLGQIAMVRRDLRPEGRVWFQGQGWFARSVTDREVAAGKEVRIVGLEDLTLLVEPLKTDDLLGSGE
jgi:membrane-bound serine protease (ClpP class)